MRKTLLFILTISLACLSTGKAQSCFSVTITNGMSTYQGVSMDGTNITGDSVTSGADSMTLPPGCPIPSQFSSATHTGYAHVTISSGNQLQNPDFLSGTTGWTWNHSGSTGGWSIGYGAPYGNGQFGIWTGIGTAALTNQQHILVVPGQSLTASTTGLGEPGAGGQAVLRIVWYGASGNLLSINASPSNVITNNYIWMHVSVTATAPANVSYAVIDFAILNDTVNGPRWGVWGVTSSIVKSANGAASTRCYSCYLDSGATVIEPIGSDTDWTLSYDGSTTCSVVGTVFSGSGSLGISLHTANYAFSGSLGSSCQFLLNCPNPPNSNAKCGVPGGFVINWLSKGNECTFEYLHDIRFSFEGKCFPIGMATPANVALNCD